MPCARRATWTSGRTSCRRRATSCCGGSRACDGVLTLLTDRVDDEFLDAAGPQLKVVSNYAVGFDNIDVAACARRGIPVGNTPGVLTETTADLAWALLMAAARRVPEGDRYVRAARGRRGAAAAARPRRPRRDDRHRRVRADRPGGGATGPGLRDGDPVPRPPAAATVGHRAARSDVPAARGAAAAERLRVAPREPLAGDPAPDQCRDARDDEADRGAREHVARPGGGPGGPGDGAARRRDLGGRRSMSPTRSRSRWTTRSSGSTTA